MEQNYFNREDHKAFKIYANSQCGMLIHHASYLKREREKLTFFFRSYCASFSLSLLTNVQTSLFFNVGNIVRRFKDLKRF